MRSYSLCREALEAQERREREDAELVARTREEIGEAIDTYFGGVIENGWLRQLVAELKQGRMPKESK